MLIPLECLLLMLSFFFVGYSHARRSLSTIMLAIAAWISSLYVMYLAKGNPFILPASSIPQEYAEFVIKFSLILVTILIFFGIPYLIGYGVGTVVNNVEKYQRK